MADANVARMTANRRVLAKLPSVATPRRAAPVLVYLALAAWYAVVPAALLLHSSWNSHALPSWAVAHPDIDTMLIHNGLVRHPHLRDTLSWFAGSWVMGDEIPFYRPLASVAFWCQWKVFGDHEGRYALLNLIVHLLVTVSFYRVCRKLLRHVKCPHEDPAMVVIGVAFFTGLGLDPTRQIANWLIICLSKNLPDALCAFFLLNSLHAYIGVHERRRAAVAREMWRPVIWYWAACACKETGALVPIACRLMDAEFLRVPRSPIRTAAIRRVALWLAAMLGFQVLRVLLLGGVGYRYGSNSMWPSRFLSTVLSPAGPLIVMASWVPLTTAAVGLAAVFVGRRVWRATPRFSVRCAFALAASFALVALPARVGGQPSIWGSDWRMNLAVAFLFVMEQPWASILAVCLYPVILYMAGRGRPLMVAFPYAWVVLTSIPNLMSSGPLHREYLVGMGFSLVFGYGLTGLLLPVFGCRPFHGEDARTG